MKNSIDLVLIVTILVGFFVLSTSCDKKEQDGNWPPIKFSQSEFIIGSEGGTIELDFDNYSFIWLNTLHCLYRNNAGIGEISKWDNHLEFEKTMTKNTYYFNNDLFSMTITEKHIKLNVSPNLSPTKRYLLFGMECMDAFGDILVVQEASL